MRLYEFFQDSRNYYLVTEYCAGGELLNKILSLKSFSERIAAAVMKQLLSAVAYCHAKNVVHRYYYMVTDAGSDLKLENLVLESDDIESNVKVIDFGTSRIFKNKERMQDIAGTVQFSFPAHSRITLRRRCCTRTTQRSATYGAAE